MNQPTAVVFSPDCHGWDVDAAVLAVPQRGHVVVQLDHQRHRDDSTCAIGLRVIWGIETARPPWMRIVLLLVGSHELARHSLVALRSRRKSTLGVRRTATGIASLLGTRRFASVVHLASEVTTS